MRIFVRSALFLPILLWAGLCASVSLAIAAPEVFILHKPIQPDKSQAVTYEVTANANDGRAIKSIVISVQLRELQVNNQGQVISVLKSSYDLTACNINPPRTDGAECSMPDGPYPDGYHIGYKATATNVVDVTNADRGFTYFTAGKFPSAPNDPTPDDPIPIYVQGDPAEKIDLVFIPDEDYNTLQNWEQQFMQDVTNLIWQAFFSEEPFARGVRSRSEMWNFYITYQLGRFVTPCQHIKPPNWATLRATVNNGFIVHNTPLHDCAGIGEGTLFSAEPISKNPNDPRSYTVPIHELGHSVFSLADEYRGGYLFNSSLYSHNVFKPEDICEDNARNHGWPVRDCKKIHRTRWFRSDPPHNIMEDTSSVENAPGRSDEKRYDWHYDQCVGQNC
jgi:hypothetical protein